MAGLHPDVVRRFVALGLIDASRDAVRRAVVRAQPAPRRGPAATPSRRLRPQLRRSRPRRRPPRPDRPVGGGAAPTPIRDRPDRSTTMDMNRLTQKSQEALHDAQTKALRFGHTEVDGEHLLLALLDQPDGLVPRLHDAGRGRRRPPVGRARSRAVAAAPRDAARARRPVRCSSPSASPACSMPPRARPSA